MLPTPRGSCKNALQRLVGITRKIKRKGRTWNRIYRDLVVEQVFFRRHFVVFQKDGLILELQDTWQKPPFHCWIQKAIGKLLGSVCIFFGENILLLQFTRTVWGQISCSHENLLTKRYEGSATLWAKIAAKQRKASKMRFYKWRVWTATFWKSSWQKIQWCDTIWSSWEVINPQNQAGCFPQGGCPAIPPQRFDTCWFRVSRFFICSWQ